MKASYAPFVDRMIHQYEGGYGWNKKDPGGPTKYGITCFDLAQHRGQRMNSMAAWADRVEQMTIFEAEEIYESKYAAKIRFNDLPAGIDCCMFDYGVNSGVSRPIRVAQAILHLSQTGSMDSATLVALCRLQDRTAFIAQMCAERLHFMHAIRGGAAWDEFGKGWSRRVTDLQQYCSALATSTTPAAAPDLSHVVTPKARHEDPNVTTRATAGSGAVATGGGVVAHVNHLPWAYIGIFLGVAIVAGLAYIVWKAHQAATANAKVVLPA